MPFDETLPREHGRRESRNVLGGPLASCSIAPMTGFFRNGCCDTAAEDQGCHTVCAVMTDAFLRFSLDQGNDLSTARPEFGFPGLRDGDRWCVCAPRWHDAMKAGVAPPIVLEATDEGALDWCGLDELRAHAAS